MNGFDTATKPLWEFLDSFHPIVAGWTEFPDSAEVMMDLFSDGLLDIAFKLQSQ